MIFATEPKFESHIEISKDDLKKKMILEKQLKASLVYFIFIYIKVIFALGFTKINQNQRKLFRIQGARRTLLKELT